MTASLPSVLQIGNRWFPELPAGLERYYYDLVHHLPSAGFEVLGLVLGKAASVTSPGLAAANPASGSYTVSVDSFKPVTINGLSGGGGGGRPATIPELALNWDKQRFSDMKVRKNSFFSPQVLTFTLEIRP